MTFVVFIGSLITTFFGGSVGKEGSAVAMGGAWGDYIARTLKLPDDKQRTLVICGIGSAFGVRWVKPYSYFKVSGIIDHYQTKWSERIPENIQIKVSGEIYVHWYDYMTDYIY